MCLIDFVNLSAPDSYRDISASQETPKPTQNNFIQAGKFGVTLISSCFSDSASPQHQVVCLQPCCFSCKAFSALCRVVVK